MSVSKCGPITPPEHAPTVWALPRSLATTQGIIIIFFSSPYLDVSVQEVGSPILIGVTCLQHAGLSHSEMQGCIARVQLPLPYRSLPRPSSPLRPKASTMCPYLL